MTSEVTSDQAAGTTCPDCRALVSDLEAHEAWHSRLVRDIAKAVAGELKRPPLSAPSA